MKTKKSNGDKTTNFQDKEIPKAGSSLIVITIDYAPKKGEHYYPQVFLKECKCFEIERKSGLTY